MINLFRVHMPSEAPDRVAVTLRSGYVSEGDRVVEFEQSLSGYIGNPRIATVNSCTSALTLALIMCGVGPGDEVITTPMTCMASNAPIVSLGAKIVWADIDPQTGNINPKDIAKKITSKTKAILYVHWAGQPGDVAEINKIAKERGIKVIEDAAHAFGAEYDGQKIGNHSDYVAFSFQAIKHITTGDGGMLVVNGEDADERLEKLIRIRWFGLNRKFNRSVTKWETDITEIGYKMHMNDIAASIGLCQMPYATWIVDSHRENALFYDSALKDAPGINLIRRDDRSKNAAWIYTLLLDDAQQREKFATHMLSNDIACNVVHVRNDKYSVFKEFAAHLPGVDEFCSRMINIPCGWWLSKSDRSKIADAVMKR